jgi:hypothetical protein
MPNSIVVCRRYACPQADCCIGASGLQRPHLMLRAVRNLKEPAMHAITPILAATITAERRSDAATARRARPTGTAPRRPGVPSTDR